MLNLEKMAKVVNGEFAKLIVDSARCSRSRSGLSNCTSCQEACPAGAIELTDEGPKVDNCLECGLCACVCPTGSISWKSPSPLALLAKIRGLTGSGKNVYIHCAQQDYLIRNMQYIKVPCLGSIPWECWLELLSVSDRVKLVLPENGCQNCLVTTGEQVWQRELQRAEKMLNKKMAILPEPETMPKPGTDGEVNYGRREFFAVLLNTVKKSPQKFMAGVLEDLNPEQKTGAVIAALKPSQIEKRHVLISFLKRQTHLAERITIKLPDINKNCRLCKACSLLCPQGALKQTGQECYSKIELDCAICSGCGLCVDICFYQAVNLRECAVNAVFEPRKTLIEARGINK